MQKPKRSRRSQSLPTRSKSLLVLVWLLSTGISAGQPAVAQNDGVDGEARQLLDNSRKVYAELTSYADRGTIVVESKPPGASRIVERHQFETHFRPPRSYSFEFREDPSSGGDVVAIWCDGGEAFETWWSATSVHEAYPRGQGATAFAVTAYPTHSAALQLAPLLFPGAGLLGSLENLDALIVEPGQGDRGKTLILRGVSQLGYKTGGGLERRPIEITLDAESLLVLRIVQGTPDGAPRDSVDRIETIFEPVLDPHLDSESFRFEIPTGESP